VLLGLSGGDITLGGTYMIRGRRITAQTEQIPQTLRFLLSKDEQTMLREDRGAIWERSQE
jgi:hypothetical protein